MKTPCLLFTSPGQVTLGETEIPAPGPGEVLLRTLFSTVSPGTELRVFSGRQGRMPAFPVIPGYTATAEVLEAGPGVSLLPGTTVFVPGGSRRCSHAVCWGAHVGHSVRAAADVFPLPAGVEPLAGSLTKLVAIAGHGVRAATAQPGETVAVVGLGPIGLLAARLHHAAGARVFAADRDPARVELARAGGLTAVRITQSLAADLAPLLGAGADVVVDATGVAPVLNEAIPLGRPPTPGEPSSGSARIVVQGSYAEPMPLSYETCARGEYHLLFPHDHQAGDVTMALDLMARRRLVVDDLLTTILAPAEAALGYARLQRREALLVSFDWRR